MPIERAATMKPILFNSEMVKAILDGRKTVTRRIIKPQPLMKLSYIFAGHSHGKWDYPDKNSYKYWGEEYKRPCEIPEQEESRLWTPPCHGDDILYVREAFRVQTHGGDPAKGTFWAEIEYRSGGKNQILTGLSADAESWMRSRWTPSIHMPKEVARIFLKVKTVSVERLQDISDRDLIREGEIPYVHADESFDREATRMSFLGTWNSTIKTKDLELYGWNANPWVWVITFERVEKGK